MSFGAATYPRRITRDIDPRNEHEHSYKCSEELRKVYRETFNASLLTNPTYDPSWLNFSHLSAPIMRMASGFDRYRKTLNQIEKLLTPACQRVFRRGHPAGTPFPDTLVREMMESQDPELKTGLANVIKEAFWVAPADAEQAGQQDESSRSTVLPSQLPTQVVGESSSTQRPATYEYQDCVPDHSGNAPTGNPLRQRGRMYNLPRLYVYEMNLGGLNL